MLKKPVGELHIDMNGYWLKSYTNSALIKRLGRGIKHITHQMAFTAGEDKHSLLALLNLGSQQRFYIFLLIAANLLELIDRHDTWFIAVSR